MKTVTGRMQKASGKNLMVSPSPLHTTISKDFGLNILTFMCAGNGCTQVSGTLKYNGKTLDKFVPEHTASYVDQEDNHLPTLTVLETMLFAYRCLAVSLSIPLRPPSYMPLGIFSCSTPIRKRTPTLPRCCAPRVPSPWRR
jgi:hypothetical protein